MVPRVFNKHLDNYPAGCVYVGRRSKWQSPFVLGRDGTSEEVREKYKAHVKENQQLSESLIKELKGKNLLCSADSWHGEILLEVANS
ncbi:MAG: DUF4326 domain-containing protein [Methylophilus sp.]|uniref:DUF4326 domain-containing protein n=1 Tax=Methylophilus sp. TaxID=29541 RepID=UPI003FA060CD